MVTDVFSGLIFLSKKTKQNKTKNTRKIQTINLISIASENNFQKSMTFFKLTKSVQISRLAIQNPEVDDHQEIHGTRNVKGRKDIGQKENDAKQKYRYTQRNECLQK